MVIHAAKDKANFHFQGLPSATQFLAIHEARRLVHVAEAACPPKPRSEVGSRLSQKTEMRPKLPWQL